MKFYILALFIPLLMVIIHSECTLSLAKIIQKMLGNSNQHKDQDSKEKEIFTKGSLSISGVLFNRLKVPQLFPQEQNPLPKLHGNLLSLVGLEQDLQRIQFLETFVYLK